MADTVNTDVVSAAERSYTIHLQNKSDGTGEAAVTKLDISTLLGPRNETPTKVTLMEARYDIQGFSSVQLFWDHTTDDEMLTISGQGYMVFTGVGGLRDPASAGGTGDVLLTTIGASSTATYDITLVFKLEA